MVGLEFERVGVLGHQVLHLREVACALVFDFFEQFYQYHTEHFRVVARTVMVKIPEIEVLSDCVELVIFQLRIRVTRQSDGIHIRHREFNLVILCYFSDERRIK